MVPGPRNEYIKPSTMTYVEPKVAMSIHKGLLYLPEDPLTPTVFMSLGTGVAPFRAFLQEREQLHKEGQALGPCTYYYGCRYEKKDFVFGDYIKV